MAQVIERDSTASNFIWAIALIIIVGMIMGGLYYGGVFKNLNSDKKMDVDVEISAPAAPAAPK